MHLTNGARLGPYEIVAPIGSGGMGEVYRAKDTRLDRTVAIKVLPAHLAVNTILRQRLEREAKTVSSLNHPHICILHDIGHQDGIDYLVMEYLEGETLAARVWLILNPAIRRCLRQSKRDPRRQQPQPGRSSMFDERDQNCNTSYVVRRQRNGFLPFLRKHSSGE